MRIQIVCDREERVCTDSAHKNAHAGQSSSSTDSVMALRMSSFFPGPVYKRETMVGAVGIARDTTGDCEDIILATNRGRHF